MFVVFTHAILSSADQVRIVIYRTFEFDIFIKLLKVRSCFEMATYY